MYNISYIFDTSFFTALYAKGRIKENALLSPAVVFICFPIVFVLFKMGASPIALSWAYLVSYAILGLIVKPFLINKIADYKWGEIYNVFLTCGLVSLVAVPIPLFLYWRLGVDTLLSGFIVLFASLFFVLIAIWTVGLAKSMRRKVLEIIRNRISALR